jgi:hypothetical protein
MSGAAALPRCIETLQGSSAELGVVCRPLDRDRAGLDWMGRRAVEWGREYFALGHYVELTGGRLR